MEKKTLLSRIWQGFSIDLPLTTFEAMIETETTWKDLFDMMDKFKDLRNSYLGYNLGNSCYNLLPKGEQFAFRLYGREFFLYADEGCTLLLNFFIEDPEKVPSKEEVEKITTAVNNYHNHKIYCSCCEKEIHEDGIAGRYFAGVYCTDCWESKYKALEAAETYD